MCVCVRVTSICLKMYFELNATLTWSDGTEGLGDRHQARVRVRVRGKTLAKDLSMLFRGF